jgi:hypothetical protein
MNSDLKPPVITGTLIATGIVVVSFLLTLAFPVVISVPVQHQPIERHKGDIVTEKELEIQNLEAEQAMKTLKELATPERLLRLTWKRMAFFVLGLALAILGALVLLRSRFRRYLTLSTIGPILVVGAIGALLICL